MLACLDVDYRADATVAGCVLFHDWSDDASARQILISQGPAAPYKPGEFYLRELPPILAVLQEIKVPLETIVVDGYVWLDPGKMGLGAHLYSALNSKVPVIGVAKNPWRNSAEQQDEHRAVVVTRGGSKRPLYVTAVGVEVASAASLIAGMHGPFRIPTLLAAVNTLVRTAK